MDLGFLPFQVYHDLSMYQKPLLVVFHVLGQFVCDVGEDSNPNIDKNWYIWKSVNVESLQNCN